MEAPRFKFGGGIMSDLAMRRLAQVGKLHEDEFSVSWSELRLFSGPPDMRRTLPLDPNRRQGNSWICKRHRMRRFHAGV